MKKILTSLSTIVITLAIVTAGALAYFTDWGNRIGTTFSEGELILKIRDQDERYKEGGVVGTWTAENMMPGDRWIFRTPFFKTPFVGLLSEGDIQGDYLEIACNYSVIEEDPRLESDTAWDTDLNPDRMAEQIIITKSVYFGIEGQENGKRTFCVDALQGKKYRFFNPFRRSCFGVFSAENDDWKIEDLDEDGKITFLDLKNDKLDNLPPPNKRAFYIMDIMFDANAGNDFQGDAFNLEMSFTLN